MAAAVTEDCRCRQPPFSHADVTTTRTGEDTHGATIRHLTCKCCGQIWLHYLVEEPHHTAAGRWWRAPIAAEVAADLAMDAVRAWLEAQPWCFVGGSFFASAGHRSSAPIRVF